MIDIHTHLIPNVDDGSSSMEESLDMIRFEISQGVDVAYCTPHFRRPQYDAGTSQIRYWFDELKKEVEKNHLPIQLYLGQEIYCSGGENIDWIQMLKDETILPFENEKKVLLEFPYTIPVNNIEEILYRFSLHGYKVIIAHVERYIWMKKNHYKMMKELGAKLQVNAGSLLGDSGFHQKSVAKKLLKQGYISYIASDIHTFRRPNIKKAMEKFEKYLR